jgi:hypothetical protein
MAGLGEAARGTPDEAPPPPALIMSAQRRSAITLLAASEVWYASQNTNSLRSRQGLVLGRHSPPTSVSTLQHDVCAVVNPANVTVRNSW